MSVGDTSFSFLLSENLRISLSLSLSFLLSIWKNSFAWYRTLVRHCFLWVIVICIFFTVSWPPCFLMRNSQSFSSVSPSCYRSFGPAAFRTVLTVNGLKHLFNIMCQNMINFECIVFEVYWAFFKGINLNLSANLEIFQLYFFQSFYSTNVFVFYLNFPITYMFDTLKSSYKAPTFYYFFPIFFLWMDNAHWSIFKFTDFFLYCYETLFQILYFLAQYFHMVILVSELRTALFSLNLSVYLFTTCSIVMITDLKLYFFFFDNSNIWILWGLASISCYFIWKLDISSFFVH